MKNNNNNNTHTHTQFSTHSYAVQCSVVFLEECRMRWVQDFEQIPCALVLSSIQSRQFDSFHIHLRILGLLPSTRSPASPLQLPELLNF